MLNPYRDQRRRTRPSSADYEKTYAQYEGSAAAAHHRDRQIDVDIYPTERRATIDGHYP